MKPRLRNRPGCIAYADRPDVGLEHQGYQSPASYLHMTVMQYACRYPDARCVIVAADKGMHAVCAQSGGVLEVHKRGECVQALQAAGYEHKIGGWVLQQRPTPPKLRLRHRAAPVGRPA